MIMMIFAVAYHFKIEKSIWFDSFGMMYNEMYQSRQLISTSTVRAAQNPTKKHTNIWTSIVALGVLTMPCFLWDSVYLHLSTGSFLVDSKANATLIWQPTKLIQGAGNRFLALAAVGLSCRAVCPKNWKNFFFAWATVGSSRLQMSIPKSSY